MLYAVYCDPGPGDILRFFHGLSELVSEKQENVTLFSLKQGNWKSHSLLEHMKPLNEVHRVTEYIADDLNELNVLMKDKARGPVYYCFETDFFETEKKVLLNCITSGIPEEFILLDRYNNQHYIRNRITDHLIMDGKSNMAYSTALLFVRISNIVPERNMTKELFKEVLCLCWQNGYRVKIAGSFLPLEYEELLNSFWDASVLYSDHRYPDYYQQICDYSQYSFAVGMNSGGLDLAAAAGIPLLRIGEFHHLLSYGSIHYNDFLAGARTVNILSAGEKDISNITLDLVTRGFDELLLSKKEEIINV